MDITLRIFIMVVSVLVFYNVIYNLVKRRLNESNSILWICIGLLTLVIGFYPKIIDQLAYLVGIDYPPTLLFLGSTVFMMLIIFKNSIHISKSEAKINEIAITVSILREENRRLNKIIAEQIDEDIILNKNTSEGRED